MNLVNMIKKSIPSLFFMVCLQISASYGMSPEVLEKFGKTPLELTEINAFIDALFPIHLRFCTIEVNPYKVKNELQEQAYNTSSMRAVTYAYIWKKYIEEPLKEYVPSFGKSKINVALKEWVQGYKSESRIVSPLICFLRNYDYLITQSQAEHIISWLLYQIDKTY